MNIEDNFTLSLIYISQLWLQKNECKIGEHKIDAMKSAVEIFV